MTETAQTITSSPVAVVGTITQLLAFVLAAWCIVAGIAGNVRKHRRLVLSSVYGLYAFAALSLLAAALIIYAFVTHDYSIRYVASTSDTSMSVWYKITAFWGALDGSLLFWVVVLALFSAVAVKSNFQRHRDMIGYVVAVIMSVQLFFLALIVFGKNPFATFLTTPPVDGEGLNPLLQNYWMVIHPPSLYIGFVAATIPFAFGIAALASGRLDDMWLASVRSWMLVCFFFLSLGLILGGRWAYEELGWGGYWAWDPVENAGLLPWFTATAFLHSIIIQEQRGMFKRWNLVLVILTFFLTIVGTWMTRSGVVQSVHAFGQDNDLALQFIVFMLLILVVSLGLLQYRANKLVARAEFESFASREYAFLMNNWVLLGCGAFVFFATMFPTISEALDGERVSVGPAFFNKIMTPVGLVLLFLAGAAPLLAWRRSTRDRLAAQFAIPAAMAALTVLLVTLVFPAIYRALEGGSTPVRVAGNAFGVFSALDSSGHGIWTVVNFALVGFVAGSIGQEFVRGVRVRRQQTGSDPVTSLMGLVLLKRRKYGGYIVHFGVAVLFFGFAGKAYETVSHVTVPEPAFAGRTAKEVGEKAGALPTDHPSSFFVRGYRFVYEDLKEIHNDNRSEVIARLSLWKNGKKLADMTPSRRDYHRGEQPTTEVSIEPQWKNAEDVYAVLTGFDLERKLANVTIYINPLINWVWVGYIILAFGTLICLIPNRLVEAVSPPPKTRLGRAADVGVLVLVAVGLLAGTARIAVAQSPAPGTSPLEHEAPQKAFSSHNDSQGHAHRFRPRNATETTMMKDLVCLCGGCKRENIEECKCSYAAGEREKVQLLMDQYKASGLSESAAAKRVLATFVREYGGEHVLSNPSSPASWLFPTVAAVGGLGLLLALGRRWVARGQKKMAAAPGAAAEDQQYADRLDDELRDAD